MRKPILFAASDAGGLKNLVPVALTAKEKGLILHFYVSDHLTHLVPPGIFPQLMAFRRDEDPHELSEAILRESDFEKIFLGTTGRMSVEKFLTKAARERSIKTIVLLDEWYNYRMRFEDERNELEFLPDIIVAMDESCKAEAIAEGVPESSIVVCGSALLGFEKEADPKFFPLRSLPFLEEVDSQQSLKLLFLSDEIDSLQLDYDQHTVLVDLESVCSELQTNQFESVVLFEKLHPASRKAEGVRETSWGKVISSRKADLFSLVRWSDRVVGMSTFALIESFLWGKESVSYQPGEGLEGFCTAARMGWIQLLREREQLKEWIMSSHKAENLSLPYGLVRPGACQNILNL